MREYLPVIEEARVALQPLVMTDIVNQVRLGSRSIVGATSISARFGSASLTRKRERNAKAGN